MQEYKKVEDVMYIEGTKVCEIHGEQPRRFIRTSSVKVIEAICPKCAQVLNEQNRAEQAERELKEKRQREQRAMEESGIPKVKFNAKWEDYKTHNEQTTYAKQVAMAVARCVIKGEERVNCLMTGGVGLGKTLLCVLMIKEVLKERQGRRFTAKILTAEDLISEVQASYKNPNLPSEADILKKYSTMDLVVLDDVGAERVSDNGLGLLGSLISKRYDNALSTVIVSNKNKDDLLNHIPSRAADRIFEDARCLLVKLVGESWRRKKQFVTLDEL